MKKYKFLILFTTLLSLISFNKVFAQENYNTFYNFEIEEDMFNLDKQFSTNFTYKDVLDNLITLSNDYYDFYIYLNKNTTLQNNIRNEIIINLYRKNTSLNVQYSGQSSTSSPFYTKSNSSDYIVRQFLIRSSSSSSFDFSSDIYTALSNCLNNNNCPGGYVSYNFGTSTDAFSFPDLFYKDLTTSFNNTDSFNLVGNNVPDSNLQGWFYYSTIPLIYSNSLYNDSSILLKNFKFNEIEVGIGQEFPTYLDLFSSESDSNIDINRELDNYNSLSNFYFRINKNDISNFSFTYEFNPLYALTLAISNPNYFEDFYNDLGVGIKYFGRKYDSTNNYYIYDEINCNLTHTYIKNSNTINSNGSNLICSTDLTDYDYIYLYIDQFLKSNDSINPTIKYVNLQVNSATYHYGDYIGFIYDKFDNLTSDFEMSFSSNETGFSSVYSNIDYGLIAEKIRVNNSEGFVPTALTIQPLEFSYDYKAYYVVFNDSNKYNGIRNIEFFTFPNTIISFSDKENNKFYIYDENKNINSVTARIQYYLNDTSSYDLNYYFKQVNDYINGLSVQITNIGNLTQNFYDNMPDFLQTFIFIAFILSCIYFTYKLIKK